MDFCINPKKAKIFCENFETLSISNKEKSLLSHHTKTIAQLEKINCRISQKKVIL